MTSSASQRPNSRGELRPVLSRTSSHAQISEDQRPACRPSSQGQLGAKQRWASLRNARGTLCAEQRPLSRSDSRGQLSTNEQQICSPDSSVQHNEGQRSASKSSTRDNLAASVVKIWQDALRPNSSGQSREEQQPVTRPSSRGQLSSMAQEPIKRRDLTLRILRVDIKLYRRTRTASDVVRCPPHFVYHLRVDWNSLPEEHNSSQKVSPTRPTKRLPGDPWLPGPPMVYAPVDWSSPPLSQLPSPRRPCSRAHGAIGTGFIGSSHTGIWWESLPERYVVKRKWQDLARFHEVLINKLIVDPATGLHIVKGKIPDLPNKGDLDSWLHACAATEDACALNRKQPLNAPSMTAPRSTQAQIAHLDNLHRAYVEQRLAPYFVEVNKIIRELPTEILAGSDALHRLVFPGSAGHRDRSSGSGAKTGEGPPLRKRFLGPKVPVMPDDSEDIAEAWRSLQAAERQATKQPMSFKSY